MAGVGSRRRANACVARSGSLISSMKNMPRWTINVLWAHISSKASEDERAYSKLLRLTHDQSPKLHHFQEVIIIHTRRHYTCRSTSQQVRTQTDARTRFPPGRYSFNMSKGSPCVTAPRKRTTAKSVLIC